MSVRFSKEELERVGYVIVGRVQGVAFAGGPASELSGFKWRVRCGIRMMDLRGRCYSEGRRR